MSAEHKPHSERLRELLSRQPEGEGAVILSEDECLYALDDLRSLIEQYEVAQDALRKIASYANDPNEQEIHEEAAVAWAQNELAEIAQEALGEAGTVIPSVVDPSTAVAPRVSSPEHDWQHMAETSRPASEPESA